MLNHTLYYRICHRVTVCGQWPSVATLVDVAGRAGDAHLVMRCLSKNFEFVSVRTNYVAQTLSVVPVCYRKLWCEA